MTHFYVFGDSIAQGSWDPFGGWVQRVRRVLDEHYLNDPDKRFLSFNMGISGDTSERILKRFPAEMKARYNADEPLIILFAVGMNDSLVDFETGTNQISEADFEDNIKKLTGLARQYTDKIGFVGLNPINEAEVNPIPWSPGSAYWFNAVHSYNSILDRFCADNDIPFVDVWARWQGEDYKDWLFDGVHPNALGHQKIASVALKQFLKPLGWVVSPENEGGYISLD